MAKNHMSARTLTIVIVAMCALFAGGAYTLGVMNMKQDLPKEETGVEATSNTPKRTEPDVTLLEVTADDIVMGKDDAPVTIVEYSSLSCPHCAHFHTKELPKLQEKLIDTGKAKLVTRSFPLNAPALKAAMVVDCASAEDKEKFLKVLFEMQQDWAFSSSYMDSLKQIAAVGGMSNEAFTTCVNDKAREDKIIKGTEEASERLLISATPTIFVAGKAVGSPSAEAIEEAVNKASTK